MKHGRYGRERALLGAAIEALEHRRLLTVPVISNFNFNYETTHSLTLDVSPNMAQGAPGVTDPLTDTDLILEQVGTDTNVAEEDIQLAYNGTNPGTFSFTGIDGSPNPNGTILTDGNYRGSISRQDVVHGTDPMADDAVHDFFVFAGDLTGGLGGARDRVVNLQDFNILAGNFGMTGASYSDGDVNYDGTVNLQDFNRLAGNFGMTMPEPPTNSDAIEVGEGTSTSLTVVWFDDVAGETGWRIQQSSDGQVFDTHYNDTTGSGSVRSFVVPNLQDGSRYWFRVRAYSDPATNPEGPNTAYTPKRAANTVLPVPTITSVEALSSTQLKVVFTDNSQNEDYFEVRRSTSPTGTFTPVGQPILSGAPTQFIDFGLTPGTTYYYQVVARNEVIDSSPSLHAFQTTLPATAVVDLDVWEDVNGDFVHDNSSAAEELENRQPTALPQLESDGDYVEFALVLDDVVAGATVTFNYSASQLQIYKDAMGQTAINPSQVLSLSDFFGITESGIVPVFAKATAGGQFSTGVTAQLGGGSTGSNAGLQGGTSRRTEDPNAPDDDPTWHDGTHDNHGGLDDGDGPAGDPLTDRDNFWTTHAGKTTLIIGFTGHTQSDGRNNTEGQIWDIEYDPVDQEPGAYFIGDQIRQGFTSWAVTMFPEDPGNSFFPNIFHCGDGVIGKVNPLEGNQRVDADGRPTGALPFLVDAIMNRNVNRIGLFGYSHGGGSVDILIQALVSLANEDGNLRTRLTTGGVRFFWSAYIDAINIALDDLPQGQFEATGSPFAEERFPIRELDAFGLPAIGTLWHFNASQTFAVPFWRDGVPLGGTDLDPEEWTDFGRNSNFLRQERAEPPDPRWPNGTDHTNRRGRGIAEDDTVYGDLFSTLVQALNDTF